MNKKLVKMSKIFRLVLTKTIHYYKQIKYRNNQNKLKLLNNLKKCKLKYSRK